MERKITVTFQDLLNASKNVETNAVDYQRAYQAVESEVSELENSWKGEDNIEFTKKIREFKSDLEKMYNLMMTYSNYLKTAGDAYKTTQNTVKNDASKLRKYF